MRSRPSRLLPQRLLAPKRRFRPMVESMLDAARHAPDARSSRSWWPHTTGRCASTQLLAGAARPDAAARALRGDRRGRRLVRRHAGRPHRRGQARRAAPLHTAAGRARAGPPSRATAAGGSPGLRSWPSPTTTACPRPPGSRRSSAAARTSPDAIVRGRTLPEPGRGALARLLREDVHIDGPSPHFETCNVAYPRALLERIGGFDESFGTGLRRGLRPRLPRRRGRRVAGVRAGRPGASRRVSRAGPRRRSRDALLATDARALVQATTRGCAATCRSASSTTARTRCCCSRAPALAHAPRAGWPRCSPSRTRWHLTAAAARARRAPAPRRLLRSCSTSSSWGDGARRRAASHVRRLSRREPLSRSVGGRPRMAGDGDAVVAVVVRAL